MFKPVESKGNFPELEKRILQFWKEKCIFEKSVQGRPDAPLYVFYEGPPTANGSPGIHHVLARVFKDVVPRYWTMKGYRVPRKGGWDTHGLPVELEVEQELGFTSKQDIETYGIAEFNAKCKESVFRYLKEWEAMTERIGFWIDMQKPYVTFENYYIESGWWIIKQLWERGLIYQDYKVTPHCPRCGTSLSSHEVALGYKDDADDPSIYVLFPLRQDVQPYDAPAAKELGYDFQENCWTEERPFLLAWTTTPWTLTGNVALAVAPDAPYVLVDARGPQGVTRRIILAEALADSVLGNSIVRRITTVQGSELAGLYYEPLYDFLIPDNYFHRVTTGDFVSMTEGTGIVHIAPAFGEVDLELGRAESLPLLQTVDLRGNFIPQVTRWAGMWVKDAEHLIIDDLKSRGLMYRSEKITHTYPFCWRCDTPLLYYAKSSWYIKTTAIKDRLIAANEEINWYPDYIKRGRFGDWLKNNVDWAFSRERYWGTPLPLWRCESCGTYECVSGRKELSEKPELRGFAHDIDLHRPFVDQVTFACHKCQGTMRRVPEVIDCWFDSGAMPVAQWHYPFQPEHQGTERPPALPADFICEAVDQTRGWFYSLHALSVLLFNQPCYKNVICLGHILDAKGEKMSKSRGNVVDPWSVLDTYGADALRWYLYTATPPGNARRFSADLVGETLRKFLLTLWNTYSFFVVYANIDKFDPRESVSPQNRSTLDRWILSELNSLVREADKCLSNYDPTAAGRHIQDFVEELSNWYVRRSRRRFWKSENDVDKLAAHSTLYECLATLSRLLAPLAPFVAEEMYQNLVRSVDASTPESVHLNQFPTANDDLIDERLAADTRLVMKVVSMGRAARSKAGIKVRQPISAVQIFVDSEDDVRRIQKYEAEITEELNCKQAIPTLQVQKRLTLPGLLDLLTNNRFQITVKPNLERIGQKFGPKTNKIWSELKNLRIGAKLVIRDNLLQKKEPICELFIDNEQILFSYGDLEIVFQGPVAQEGSYLVWIDDQLTPELKDEGLARELVHRLQTMRKNAGFDYTDRIVTYYQGSGHLGQVLSKWASYVKEETLSLSLIEGAPPPEAHTESHRLEGEEVTLGVKKPS